MTNRVRSRIKQAAKAATNSNDKFKIGCVLYKGANLLSSGFNQMKKTHRAACEHYDFPFIHAEYSAIKSVKYTSSLKNCSVYVARVDRFGNYAMSKPCEGCQEMLKNNGIKTVYFTTDNGIEKIKL